MVEAYAEVKERRDVRPGIPLRLLLAVADLDGVMEQLPYRLWEVVLLHGPLGLTTREVGELLSISAAAVSKRYRQAIEELVFTLNGGYNY